MRLGAEPLRQYRREARLADAGFTGDQDHLAIPRLSARPAAQQKVDLLVAADQRGQRRSTQRLEAALDDTGAQYSPGHHRLGDALDFNRTEITDLKEPAHQAARACG